MAAMCEEDVVRTGEDVERRYPYALPPVDRLPVPADEELRKRELVKGVELVPSYFLFSSMGGRGGRVEDLE